jgi:tetratricopeptide (TPR) repeat protein
MSILVDQAIQKAHAGDYDSARDLLQQAVIENPSDPRAWYLLSQVIDDNAKAVECLERALVIQPNNQQVKDRLESLRSSLSRFEELTPFPQPPTIPTPKPINQPVFTNPATAKLVRDLCIIAIIGLSMYICGTILQYGSLDILSLLFGTR